MDTPPVPDPHADPAPATFVATPPPVFAPPVFAPPVFPGGAGGQPPAGAEGPGRAGIGGS